MPTWQLEKEEEEEEKEEEKEEQGLFGRTGIFHDFEFYFKPNFSYLVVPHRRFGRRHWSATNIQKQIVRLDAAGNMSIGENVCAAVIKFGGAVLTDKTQIESINEHGFASCVKLAAQLPPRSCMIHGAGSFGHFHAARFNVKNGASATQSFEHHAVPVGWGLCETRRSVLKLNSMLFSALIDAGRAASPLHPMDSWFACDAVVSRADFSSVERCIRLNILPVLHGDVIFDDIRGWTVLSGDDIVQHLSSKLRPPFVLFVSDVPGVFLQPPASAAAATIDDSGFVTLCVVDSSSDILRLHTAASDQRRHGPASLEVGGSNGTDITGGLYAR